MITATFTDAGLGFWGIEMTGPIAEVEPIYAQVIDLVNGRREKGPVVTAQLPDGREVQAELTAVYDDTCMDHDHDQACVIFGYAAA